MTTMRTQSTERGFSLVELLIAMTVTLIITGAVYGLLTGGQNAFRREPELTDRQQNIRVAMDLIMRDIGAAGAGMGSFTQIFRNNENGTGPMGSGGANSDRLEILGNDGTCPDVRVQLTQGSNLTSAQTVPSCFAEPSLVIIYNDDGTTKWGLAFNMHAADKKFNFPGGQNASVPTTIQNANDLDPPGSPDPVNYGRAQLFRYEIANATGDTVPSLWRSERGGVDIDGNRTNAPNPAGGWQLVARGVEDMQVEYQLGGAWQDTPGVVAAANFNTITQQVRVRLSARAESRNIQGATNAAGAGVPAAMRGQLVSVGVPRAALIAMASPGPWQ
jgi:prepilin-type N-terminal cleavage/methylation domain-containing protein